MNLVPLETDRLAQLTTEQLRAELAAQLGMTAEALSRMAGVVRELESRGEDLSDLKLGIVHYLRRIADGRILPEVVVRFAGRPALLDRIGMLPLAEQQRLATGESIRLIVRDAEGRKTHLLADPANLTPQQVRQVFARDHLRDEAEQVLVLQQQLTDRKSGSVKARGECRPDVVRGGIVVRRTFVPLGDVLAALTALRGADLTLAPDEEFSTVPIRLAESEHRALKVLAAQSDCTMGDLIRRALAAAGMISRKDD